MVYATLGVLGGMGPAATVDFLSCLIDAVDADRDQDHVPVLVHGDPRVPDRTAAIRDGGPSPLPALREGIRFLDGAGVAAIAIPCNTAHYWFEDLRVATARPVLHIVDAVLDRLKGMSTTKTRIGVLSTDGTRSSGLYRRRLAADGFEVIEPCDDEMGQYVEPGIAAVKAGRLAEGAEWLRASADSLVDRGAAVLIVACTDISVVISEDESSRSVPIIDANKSLAGAAVRAVTRHVAY